MFEANLKGEGGSVLIKDGWNTHRVLDITYGNSKSSGNPMYTLILEEPESGSIDTVYLVDVRGKRFMLKQFCAACNIQEDKDGNVTFCEEDVIGCSIDCRNVPEDNEFTRKDGTVVKEKRNKIQGVRKAIKKATV